MSYRLSGKERGKAEPGGAEGNPGPLGWVNCKCCNVAGSRAPRSIPPSLTFGHFMEDAVVYDNAQNE